MSLTEPITFPFFEGASVSLEVPHKYPVALAGRPFLLDLASNAFEDQTIEPIRQQQDTSDEPGGPSLNPLGLWRRVQDDWSHGAGQTYYDRPTSDRARFRISKGVDVLSTPHQITLLPDTTQKRASVATNLQLVVAGSYLYLADASQVYSTTDLTTWSSRDVHDGEGAQSVKAIATDGNTVFAALGSNGIHSGAAGSDFAHYSDLSATLVAYVKGRLMAANGNAIYNVTASGAAPSALFTHPNTGFTWVGFAEGPGAIYAAGYGGDKSLIYRTSIKADGTALDIPVHAGSLFDGEIIRTIEGLGEFLLVGTDKGWRLLVLDDSGNVTSRSDLIPTSSAVLCFETQDHFVWYGLTNYDTVSTGLGKADPGVFTKGINPAFASDLMVTGQGAVLSVVTFSSMRVFAVSGLGVYQESTDKVAQGTLEPGLTTYGISQQKVAMFLDVRHDQLAGSYAAWLSTDRGTFERVGMNTTAGTITSGAFPAGQRRGNVFETRLELNRSSVDTTTGPTVTQLTLMSNPVIDSGEYITAPLLIALSYTVDEGDVPRDPAADMTFIRNLRADRNVVNWQHGSQLYPVTVEEFRFLGYRLVVDDDGAIVPEGTCLVKMKTIPEAA